MSRRKYLPGPTDVAVLSLGGKGDDESETRREAVRAVLGHLQRREGEVATIPPAILRDVAWEVDAGETADTALEAWAEYVRPALAALDTVNAPDGVRWRYVGESEAAETTRAADAPDDGEGDESAALAATVGGDHPLARALDRKAQAARDDAERGVDRKRNRDAALAAGTLDDGREPSSDDESAESDDRPPMLDSDETLRARSWTPGNSSPATPRGPANIDGKGTLGASSAESESEGESKGPTCAMCGDPLGADAVTAPVMHAQFGAGDELHPDCFAALAAGQSRVDGLDGR
jgi:hypothetical protein